MNSDERRALWQFITIYTLSSLLLITIIGLLYYFKEVDAKRHQSIKDLKNSTIAIKVDLMEAAMHQKPFILHPARYGRIHIGLFDQNHILRHSTLQYLPKNLQPGILKAPRYIQMTTKLDEPIEGLSYIVTENTALPAQISGLKLLIALTVLFSGIFIAFIGYLLSRLLLKPVKERIARLDRFIKESAHEINTPVSALMMSVSSLRKKGIEEERLLSHIAISSKQIADIYNSLSDIAFSDLRQKPDPVIFNFQNVIRQECAFYREIAATRGITIESDLKSHFVKMAKEDAKRIVGNLLSNAIKYNRQNGEVKISLKENSLQISDNGIGIDPKDHKSIFTRYTRISKLSGGFGIGLHIVDALCRDYNIKIRLKSIPAEGTIFTLDLRSVTVS